MARADDALLRGLGERAPLLALVLMLVQLALYSAAFLGSWGDVEVFRWVLELDQATRSALGLLLAGSSLLVAMGVSCRERRYGHDGWWWGFGVFVLGAIGAFIWLFHYGITHRLQPPSVAIGAET